MHLSCLGPRVVRRRCTDSSTTAPRRRTQHHIHAQLLPANETPPITGAEATASGAATLVFVPTKDSAGNITSAVGTVTVSAQNFPAGSTITLAHIHSGAAGVAGGIFLGFIPGALVPEINGAASFSQTSNATGDQLTSLMNNPAGVLLQRAHRAESRRRDARATGENSVAASITVMRNRSTRGLGIAASVGVVFWSVGAWAAVQSPADAVAAANAAGWQVPDSRACRK